MNFLFILTIFFLCICQFIVCSKVEDNEIAIYPMFYCFKTHNECFNIMNTDSILIRAENEKYRLIFQSTGGRTHQYCLDEIYPTIKDAKDQRKNFMDSIIYHHYRMGLSNLLLNDKTQKTLVSELLDNENRKILVPKFLAQPKNLDKIIQIYCKKYKANSSFKFIRDDIGKCIIDNFGVTTDIIINTSEKIIGYIDAIFKFSLGFKTLGSTLLQEKIYIMTKISSSSTSEIIREINLLRKHINDDFFILAYDFGFCESELQILENANILPIELSTEFETWFDEKISEPPKEKPERLVF